MIVVGIRVARSRCSIYEEVGPAIDRGVFCIELTMGLKYRSWGCARTI